MKLREFTESDGQLALALAEDLGLSPWSLDDYRKELKRKDSIMIVGEAAGTFAGFMVGRIVPGSSEGKLDAEIYNIGVAPEFQRAGVGAALLGEFLRRCRIESVKNVWLEARAANSNAIRFYRNAGFKDFDVRSKFYRDPPDDALVMQLDLEGERR